MTTFQYDQAGRNTAVTDPLNHTTTIAYDALHRVTRVTDPNGMARAWTYDKVGNVTGLISGSAAVLNNNLGYKVSATYYLANLQKESREPLPTAAISAPAGVNVPATEPGDPAGTTYNITRTHYNQLGQKVEEYDGNGYRTSYGYDDLDRLLSVTQHLDGGNLVTQYGYDNNGNRTTLTDARSKITRFRYDGLNRTWRRTNALGINDVEYRFDDAGNMSQKIEPRSLGGSPFTGTTAYTYDLAHRVTRISYQRSTTYQYYRASDVVQAYDGAGRRVYMWDGYGPNFFTYDDITGGLQEERGLQKVVSYGYDLASRLTEVTSHLGRTTYEYDGGNRLTRVQDPLGNQTTYGYDANYGQLSVVTLPLGAPRTLTRQDAYYQLADGRVTNRLRQRTYSNLTTAGNLQQPWQGTYTYDLPGMVRTLAETNTSNTPVNQTYIYDQAYRLVQADGASKVTNHPNLYYAYDAAGNRTTWGNALESGTIYNYNNQGTRWQITQQVDDANRVTSHAGVSGQWDTKVMVYEGNGNTAAELPPSGYRDPCNWSRYGRYTNHDDANRLVEVVDSQELSPVYYISTFMYDGDGNRLAQVYQSYYWPSCVGGAGSTDFTAYEYANGQVLNERHGGGVPVWYIRDPGGQLLYTLHWRTAGSVSQLQPDAYIKDHLGSVRYVVGYDGYVANGHEYDPFGALTSSSTLLRNAYKFTAHALDDRTGMYFAKARYYHPNLGRFMTQDTYLGNPWTPCSMNLYAYVCGNPVNYVDPSGHFAVAAAPAFAAAGPPGWIVGGILAGGTALGCLFSSDCRRTVGEAVTNAVEAIGNLFSTDDPIRTSADGNVLVTDVATEDASEAVVTAVTGDWRRAARRLGVDEKTASKNIHDVKRRTGRGGADNIKVDDETGDIIDPQSGEVIGNIAD